MSPSPRARIAAAIAVAAIGLTGSPAMAPPAAVAAPPTPNAPPATAPAEECTLSVPTDPRDHGPASCLAADLQLDRLPTVGGSTAATLRLSSEVEVPRARVTLRIPSTMEVTADGFGAPRQRGLTTVMTRTVSLAPGELELPITVRAVEAGPSQLTAVITDLDRPAPERAARATSELTVAPAGERTTPTVDTTSSQARGTDGTVSVTRRATPARAASSTPGQSCAAGRFQYADVDGAWHAGERVGVTVKGQTSASAPATTLASGLTGTESGAYSLCFDAATTPLATMWVEFTTVNPWWEIVDLADNPYVVATAPLTNVPPGSTQQFGASTAAEIHQPAFAAFDLHNGIYDVRGSGTDCWTMTEDQDCSKLRAKWEPGNTNGGYYSLQERTVYLTDGMPDAQHPVVHEAGHNLQHLLYGWQWPTFDCPSPHYLHRASGPMCGWTEGFANAVTGYVMGDGRYYYNTVDFMDLMQTGWQDPTEAPARTNPDNGSHTEARVAGAMIRLWRELDGGPQQTFRNMDQQFSASFDEWFLTDRPKSGLSIDDEARELVYQHTIDLRDVRRAERVTNPGLEDQGDGWTITGGVVGQWRGYPAPQGSYSAWMGGNGAPNTDTLVQRIRIPADRESVLSFDRRIVSQEPTDVQADRLRLQIIDAEGVTHTYGTWWNADHSSAYIHTVVDLSAFAGQRVTLRFASDEDAGQQTDFLLDQISVTATR